MDDAVPMDRDKRALKVVQQLMQRYGRDNHLVWSTENSAILMRHGDGGMALGVGDGVTWRGRAEEAVVLRHVQAVGAEGIRVPDKLLSGFRAPLAVLRRYPPSVQTTLYYLRAVLDAAIGYQGMHLSYWRGQLEDVEREVRRLIRGYEGIPTQVPRCMLRSPTAYYGEGMPTVEEAYRAHTARALNRMCHNQEDVVRPVYYHAVAEVQREEKMCPRFVWYRKRRLTAGKGERMWCVLQAVLPGEEHMLATNRKCGRPGPILVLDTYFKGAEHRTERWVMKEGVSLEVMHVRKKDMKE